MIDNIQIIYEWFRGNPIFNIITLIISITGIFLTFYFYFKSKKNKKPSYRIRTVNLIRKSLKKISTVEIFYSGQKIENLSITKIAIWNDGKETISSSDIAQNNPL